MASNQTITSANAIYTLQIPGVFGSPQQIQEFAADEAFDTEEVESAVTQVGVDGVGVAGWVPRAVPQVITLLPSSNSKYIFTDWMEAMDANNEVIYASGIILMSSVGLKYTLHRGMLTRFSTIANARRVLQARRFQVTWLPPAVLQRAITRSPM